MSSRLIRVLVVTALMAGCVAIVGAAAFGRGRAQADLQILSGSVKRVGVTRGRPVFSGSFTVANAGSATAHAFHGWVELTAAKKPAKILSRYSGGPLKAGGRVSLKAKVKMPRSLAKVHWTIKACVVLGTSRRAMPASDGCGKLATYDLTPPKPVAPSPPPTTTTTTSPGPTPTTTSTTTTTTTTSPTTTPPPPQVPTAPVSYTPDQWFFEADGLGQYGGQANDVTEDQASGGDAAGFYTRGYWAVVPSSYDSSNQTPETLVVWMHGCSGSAESDSYALTSQFNGDRPYILISLNGPESEDSVAGPDCWDTGDQTDVSQVLADITNAETHFNIDRRRVIIAGYSSGGDLAYQTIFEHADTFAGILAMNTDPVHDNIFNNDLNSAIAGAAWKFPIVHVAHDMDDTYPPTTEVGPHMTALTNAGFNVSYSVLPGDHYDADTPAGCDNYQDVPCTGGTSYDIVNHLLSTVEGDGWEAPAP